MKTFTYKSSYGFEYPNCYFVTGRYSENNNLSVRIMNDSEGPICTVTVNLGRKINDDCIVVKDYSENEGMVNWLFDNEFIEDHPVDIIDNGYVHCGVYKLTDKGKEYMIEPKNLE